MIYVISELNVQPNTRKTIS